MGGGAPAAPARRHRALPPRLARAPNAPPPHTAAAAVAARQSTLFNAIVENGKAAAANFPFCTIEPNVGIVTVPDARLAELSRISGSKDTVRRGGGGRGGRPGAACARGAGGRVQGAAPRGRRRQGPAPRARARRRRAQVPTTVEFVDIAGLVAGASKGEGLGNKFLANIRETDAICQVGGGGAGLPRVRRRR